MKTKKLLWIMVLGLCAGSVAAQESKPTPAGTPAVEQLTKMAARFAPTELRVDTSKLSAGDRKALVKLIEAGRVIDRIFLLQLWSENPALYAKLQPDKTPLGKARLHYFWINKGPWSELDGHTAFLPGVPEKKLPGANFYPPDLTKPEFESWLKTLPKEQQDQAAGFFSVIARDAQGKLKIVPYSEEYQTQLREAARLLREAAALTDNATLKKFLTTRADAFFSNDYYASDVAWMDLDAPLDITLGPYETYNDGFYGYKAAFEAYINLRNEQGMESLDRFTRHLQEIENNLPIAPQYRNPKLGGMAPIRVVDEVFSAGDGNHGVQTAAYNLPNDEQVVKEKGSKRVMLRNVQEAKFRSTLVPISRRVLAEESQGHVNFEAFFTHILAHELTHGIGPHQITVQGRKTSPRQELKELYGALEEAKADVTGLFLIQYLLDHPDPSEKQDEAMKTTREQRLYNTFLASAFRTLRFGIDDAHGRGMALQLNYLLDKGGFIDFPDGRFAVDFSRIKQAVRDLDHDLLTLEATGDYAGAKRMLDDFAVIRPEVQKTLDRLEGIPVDIEPIFVTANELAPETPAPAKAPPRKTPAGKKKAR